MNITINGSPGFDGTYDLDPDKTPYNLRELRWIKQIANVRANEFGDAFVKGDSDFWLALGLIALVRAGKISRDNIIEAAEVFLDENGLRLSIDLGDVEDADEIPPESQPPTEPIGGEELNGTTLSSGGSSITTGAGSQATSLISTGAPG